MLSCGGGHLGWAAFIDLPRCLGRGDKDIDLIIRFSSVEPLI